MWGAEFKRQCHSKTFRTLASATVWSQWPLVDHWVSPKVPALCDLLKRSDGIKGRARLHFCWRSDLLLFHPHHPFLICFSLAELLPAVHSQPLCLPGGRVDWLIALPSSVSSLSAVLLVKEFLTDPERSDHSHCALSLSSFCAKYAWACLFRRCGLWRKKVCL